jgi:hypothetical protein
MLETLAEELVAMLPRSRNFSRKTQKEAEKIIWGRSFARLIKKELRPNFLVE